MIHDNRFNIIQNCMEQYGIIFSIKTKLCKMITFLYLKKIIFFLLN